MLEDVPQLIIHAMREMPPQLIIGMPEEAPHGSRDELAGDWQLIIGMPPEDSPQPIIDNMF